MNTAVILFWVWTFLLLLITAIKITIIIKEKDREENDDMLKKELIKKLSKNYRDSKDINFYINVNNSLYPIRIKNFVENGVIFEKLETCEENDNS